MGENSRAVLDAAEEWLAALDAQELYGATPSLEEELAETRGSWTAPES